MVVSLPAKVLRLSAIVVLLSMLLVMELLPGMDVSSADMVLLDPRL
jgi:hypothetical protein